MQPTETSLESRSQSAPTLQSYTDFRKYLNDFYEFKVNQYKGSIGGYTYKTFSAAADIRSPNYLKLVIDGDRNLSVKTIKKFAKALQLSKEDAYEFELLCLYGQAVEPLERNRQLKKLSEYRMKRKLKSGEMNSEAVNKAPSWAAWVLYALADHKDSNFDLAHLKKLMKGRIKDSDIERALEMLLESGSLVRDPESGEIKKGLTMPPTLEEVPAEVIRNLQAELIYLGMESLLNDKSSEREFGSLSVCLTEDEFEKLKFELRHLRKRIYKDTLVNREKAKGDKIYQLNIQLFPITK
jgi:uncharacterized protein (TIGR02147 family)